MDHSAMALIIEYRYLILIPLSFIEGPIVAFFAGTLASLGYFNIWILAVFFFIRDVAVDSGCWALGYWGQQTPWVRRLIRRMGITDDHLGEVEALWQKYPGRTMFFSKLSYGVAAGFIVVAGLVKMPYKKFIKYGMIITLCHYILLLALGYYFGVSFGGTITGVLEKIPYIVGVLSILAVAYYIFRRVITRRLEKMEREAR